MKKFIFWIYYAITILPLLIVVVYTKGWLLITDAFFDFSEAVESWAYDNDVKVK